MSDTNPFISQNVTLKRIGGLILLSIFAWFSSIWWLKLLIILLVVGFILSLIYKNGKSILIVMYVTSVIIKKIGEFFKWLYVIIKEKIQNIKIQKEF